MSDGWGEEQYRELYVVSVLPLAGRLVDRAAPHRRIWKYAHIAAYVVLVWDWSAWALVVARDH